MRVRLICLAAGNSRRFGENKLLYEIGGKPMYRHLLERLVSIAGRHENYEVVLVSRYGEILEEAVRLAAEPAGEESPGFFRGFRRLYPVYSPESQKGISYSIRAGIRAETCGDSGTWMLPGEYAEAPAASPGEDPDSHMGSLRFPVNRLPDAYVFFVADQPWLSEKTVEAFLETMEETWNRMDGRRQDTAAAGNFGDAGPAERSPDEKDRLIGCVSHNGEPGNPVWFSAGYREELLVLTGDQGGKRVMRAHMDRVRLFEAAEAELLDLDTRADLPGQEKKPETGKTTE